MDGRKGRVVCRQHTCGGFKDIDEIRVLIGVVYMTKSRGPRTHPWVVIAFDTKTARGQIELNQLRAVP